MAHLLRRAAHFAHFNGDDGDDAGGGSGGAGSGNVHVGSNEARNLGPWSSAVELVNARQQAQAEREGGCGVDERLAGVPLLLRSR